MADETAPSLRPCSFLHSFLRITGLAQGKRTVSRRRFILKSAMQRQVASRLAKLDLWIAVKTKCLLRVLGNNLKRPIIFFYHMHPSILLCLSLPLQRTKLKNRVCIYMHIFYASVQIFAHNWNPSIVVSNEQLHPHMICWISSCENQAWQGKVRLLCSSYLL